MSGDFVFFIFHSFSTEKIVRSILPFIDQFATRSVVIVAIICGEIASNFVHIFLLVLQYFVSF